MDYISLDIETSGLDFGRHKILEIGAVAVSDGCLGDELNILIHHDEILFATEALAIHRATGLLERLEGPLTVDEFTARHMFRSWMKTHQTGTRLQGAGKNVTGFDLPFLRHHGYLEELRWGHRFLDPGSMWSRPDDIAPPNLKECCRRAGIPFEEDEKHTALPESKLVALCIEAHFKQFGRMSRGCEAREAR